MLKYIKYNERAYLIDKLFFIPFSPVHKALVTKNFRIYLTVTTAFILIT